LLKRFSFVAKEVKTAEYSVANLLNIRQIISLGLKISGIHKKLPQKIAAKKKRALKSKSMYAKYYSKKKSPIGLFFC